MRRGSDGEQIVVADGTNVGIAHGEQCLRTSRAGHKLDLDGIWRIALDNGAKIARTESCGGQIMSKDDGVQLLKLFIVNPMGRR